MSPWWFVCFCLAVRICGENSKQTCEVCTCLADKQYIGLHVDCSNRNRTAFPDTLPNNTTTLLFNNNHLLKLIELKFKNLKKLRFLDVSHNLIHMIDENAFQGLSKLLVLNLSGNSLTLDSVTYKLNVFKPLRHLTVLHIEDNNIESTAHSMYPDESLRVLTSLKELHIDGLPADFGQGFAQMRNLTTLSLTGVKGFCLLPVLRNTTFTNAPMVKHLDISRCSIESSELLTFSPLSNIKNIDLSNNNQLGFSGVTIATFGLQFSRIEVLKINNINTDTDPTTLEIAHLSHLQNTGLKELHIDGNGITKVQKGLIPMLEESLEFISAKTNGFEYGEYLLEMKNWKLLKHLDLSMAAQELKSFTQMSHVENTLYAKRDLTFPLPPNLEVFIFKHRYFGDVIAGDINGSLSSHFTILRILDISYNGIGVLPRKIFKYSISIESIDLSGNYLTDFRAYLGPLKNLSMLNLSYNSLQMISSEGLKELEYVPHVKLEGNPFVCSCDTLGFLRWVKRNSNRIQDFKKVTCVFLTVPNMLLQYLDSIIDELDYKCNSVNIMAASISFCLFLFILGLIGVSVGYRHRWKLRYLYHVGRRAYRRHEMDNDDDDNYEYDVFVSYAAPDRRFIIDVMMPELETKAELRMCIHDRDFLPGEVIATNIVNAIQNSRKTLIVLSPAFLESDWCEFEYNMGRMESVTRRNNIVVVILYKHVPLSALPTDMAVLFRNNCYLQYNDEEFGSVVFWENVVEAVKTKKVPV